MKIIDFGLWFFSWMKNRGWLTTIPEKGGYEIYYDRKLLGVQWGDFDLEIYDDKPHIINLKNKFPERVDYGYENTYSVNRQLALDDFEIIPNPEYRGT